MRWTCGSRRFRWGRAALAGVAGALIAHAALPKGANLAALTILREADAGGFAERVMLASLQGLVARRSSEQIYVEASGGYALWSRHLTERYGVPLRHATNPWAVLDRFQPFVDGYVLYDRAANPDSLNAATTLAGLLRGLAVDRSIEATVRAHGITRRLADVRARDEAWVWRRYAAALNPGVMVEQKEGIDLFLRDYAVMARAFTFYDGNSPFRTSVLAGLEPDARLLGWGDASHGEDRFIGDSSRQGVATLPADWALNLSTLSSVRDAGLFQRTYAPPVFQPRAHYVAFLVTDGDNVQWNLGGLPAYFNHPARGEFNLGWALSPALADVAPSVMRWYYDHAKTGTHRDFFVAGPSGDGYFYPSKYPPAELDRHVARLNDLLERADMNLVQILDFNAFRRLDLWDRYTRQPRIDGLFYLEYSRYDAQKGAILFSRGKPVIAARALLWDGLPGADEASVIAQINAAPRDPFRAESYTLVAVHAWSKTLGDVKTVVNGLAPEVRVVTPDELVKLIRANLAGRARFDFATGLEGWQGHTADKPYDRAEWTSAEGGGALLLDGSDLGAPDAQPNAWFSRQLALATNAATLRFRTRAVNDGRLRVRLRRGGVSWVTLLDWDTPAGADWVERVADLAPYAGETVLLYFEQNDGGQGAGEQRLLDDVVIETAAPATLPAPRLLEARATATNRVELWWRNDTGFAAAFRVERRESPDAGWQVAATVGGRRSFWTDPEVRPGAAYFYRVKSLVDGRESPPSNERAVTVAQAFLTSGGVWRYWDRGGPPSERWTAPEFDDAAWPAGPAQLGYGDGDEATVVSFGDDPANKPITTYFRQRFWVVNPEAVTRLYGQLLRDDGAVVYLNGQEVWRDNLPPGTIGPATRAVRAVSGDEENAWRSFAILPTRLRPGANEVAVEVHQSAPDSSDLSFAFVLTAYLSAPPPPLNIAETGRRVQLSWPRWAEGFFLQSAAGLSPASNWETATNTVAKTPDWWRVEIIPAADRQFYRLIHP